MPKKLSEHFTLEELVFSQTAARKKIDNTPPPEIVANLTRLANTLEIVRSQLGDVQIQVSSGYRSPALNKAIGGAKKSLHMKGLAVDFTAPTFGTVLQTARRVAKIDLGYDQIIYEFGHWVHLGLQETDKAPRHQLLSFFGDEYLDGLISKPT